MVFLPLAPIGDLRRRAADIAIRNFRPTEPDLIARKVGEFSATLYARPEILADLPSPLTDDLCKAPFIGFLSNNERYVGALAQRGLTLREEQFVARTDSHLVHWQMARAGIGIGMMPVELGDAEPEVERVFEDRVFGSDVWLVSHRELRMNLRVRTVFDFLVAELSEYFGESES